MVFLHYINGFHDYFDYEFGKNHILELGKTFVHYKHGLYLFPHIEIKLKTTQISLF